MFNFYLDTTSAGGAGPGFSSEIETAYLGPHEQKFIGGAGPGFSSEIETDPANDKHQKWVVWRGTWLLI